MRELIGKILALVSITSTAEAVNAGRESGFREIIDIVGAFQWSAILDEKTCPNCRELDGKYFEPDDPQLQIIKPPLHPNCRCILVAVLKEEVKAFPVKVAYLTPQQVSAFTVSKSW